MLIVYLVLFFTVISSGSAFFLFKSENEKVMKLLLAFSGAFLIGISFMKLVPEVFGSGVAFAGLFVMIGFLIQLVLELITEGVEHGHRHEHHENESVSPFILLTGLCVHAFLEGTPISAEIDKHITHSIVIGIVIHNIPISLTLMSLLLHYGCSKGKSLVYLTLFAIMSPLGAIISSLIPFGPLFSSHTFFAYSMAIVIGIFLHVSTSILFEAGDHHKYNIQKFIMVCIGILTAFGLCFL
ncbi:MAG: ZIP family metal transporter [Bacteroidota bacterium]